MKPRRHRGIATGIVAILILVAGVAGVVLFMNMSDSAVTTRAEADLFTVSRGDFDVTVLASGELAAQDQTEIKNLLETNAMITEIVDEGTFVRKGDVLFRLNDEEIRNKMVDAQDAIDQAKNQYESAQSDLEIAKKSRESQMAEAELRIRLAERALLAWENGTDVSQKMQLELAIKTAQKNQIRAKERYEASQRLFEQEFISKDELQGDEISLLEADSRLQQAELDYEVYMQYNRLQEKEKLESEVNQAKDEKLRIDQRTKAEVDSKTIDVSTKERQLERERERLEKLERQLEYCTITAPSDGLVVYWSSLNRDSRRNPDPPEVGTQLSRGQTVMVLPDTTRMVAEVKVNEALSGRIEPGQPATIISDAFPDRVFTGTVRSVGVLAEGGGWRDPNRRDYTVRISIDDSQGVSLKPSMRCKSTILVDRVVDAVHVPVAAVFQNGPVSYVYVPDGSGFAQRQVEKGEASELFVEILSGLEPGDRVLLREPGPEEITRMIEIPEGLQQGPSITVPDSDRDRDAGDADNRERGNARSSGSANRGGSSGQRNPGFGNMSDADRQKMREEMMKRYDKDGDGELSEEERAEMMKQFRGNAGGGSE